MGGDKNYHLVIFISIFNREKNLLCIFYQLFEHVEILYSKNFSGYFTQPTAFTINTHLYFDKINVLQVCILTVESYSMGYLEMIVRRSGIIVVIICQTINGTEIISISPFITIIYPISTITGLIVITLAKYIVFPLPRRDNNNLAGEKHPDNQ